RLRSFFEPIMRWRCAARAVRDALQRLDVPRVDFVHFMWLDDYIVGASRMTAFLLSWIFPFRWTGLFFHPWHLRIAGGETRHESVAAESMLRARNCIGVAVLDHGVAAALERNINRPVIFFPDATDEAVARHAPACFVQIQERAKGRKIVGLLGHLSRRKGIRTFMKAARECENGDWLFLMLGAMGEAEKEALSPEDRACLEDAISGRVTNICVVPERIEDEAEFNAVVCECDVLFAAYEMFAHSSGLVTKAGVFHKPIIVSKGYYMQEVVEKYRLGVAIDEGDSRAVLRALDMFGDPAEFERRVGVPDYEGFVRANGPEALGPAFDKLLECRTI
ncbi:MAG: glycosyltransferase involved in cell wall biosynthesis, partial [Kiritimatiellia bacterium]